MKNRIKTLRKALGLTQTAFGERLGVSDSTITSWEKVGPPPKSAIIAICALFNVNRQWLEDNQGEMFLVEPITKPFDFARTHGCSEAIAEIFARYCALPDEKKTVFEEIVDSLVEKKKNRASNAATVSVNNVYGDNNTTIN